MKSQVFGNKVFIGMSGGVDSSVSAALLKKQGFAVTGVFIKVWQPDFIDCTWKEDRLDAMRVAAKLHIPFITLDLEREYKKEVVDYMLREYKAGRTPNPDVMCNKEIKFGAFYKWAREQGADFVATGHYARCARTNRESRISNLEKKDYGLYKGRDEEKDQSYFLWGIKQSELPHILFPIGHLKKIEVRKLAKKFSLATAEKKDSQGLCFIGKVDMKEFLANFIKKKKGDVLDGGGKIIGHHQGAVFYTIGQRHGFTLIEKTPRQNAVYVVAKDVSKNTITVSDTPSKDKAVASVVVERVNWLSFAPFAGAKLRGRFRYRQKLISLTMREVKKDSMVVAVNSHEWNIAVGQSLVLYEGNRVVGGGVVDKLLYSE